MKYPRSVQKAVCFGAALLTIVFAPIAGAEELPLTMPAELVRIVTEGLENNQQLQSQRSKIEALRAEIPAAGALDDPMFGVALLNLPTDSFRFDQEPMTQKQISLAQKLPWFGKLDLKTQTAVLEAKKAEAQWSMQRLALARKIVITYYEMALTERGEEVNTQLIEKLSQLLQTSESRYTGGQGLQQDILQTQVEISGLREEQNDLDDKRKIMESRLNELLSRTQFKRVPAAETLPLPVITLDIEKLQQQALTNNPDILTRRLILQQAAVGEDLARKNYYPDFDVRLAYGFRENDRLGNERPDFFSAGVTLNIPIWQTRKQQPRLEGAIKRRQAAEQMLRDLQHGLPHRIAALAGNIERLLKNYRLYTETLIFQAEQWASSVQAAYEVGKLEFNTLIKAQIQVLRLGLKADTYLFRLYQKQAEMEELIGGPMSN